MLLGKNDKPSKQDIKMAEQQAKMKAQMDKFGIEFDSYNDEELRSRNESAAMKIAASLAGSKLYSFGSLLSGNANETFLMEMARAQVEQNWILMRQNEEIIRLLKDIKEK